MCVQSAGLHSDRDLHPGGDEPLLAVLHLPVPGPAQHLGAGDQWPGGLMVMLHQVHRRLVNTCINTSLYTFRSMCCQIEEEDDLEDEVENMKKAFTVSDTMVSAVSSSDLQLDSLQRLQHGRPVESPNGHGRQIMALSLQRPSYETQEEGKVKEEKGGTYPYDAVKRMETERNPDPARRSKRLKGRERGEESSEIVKSRSQSYSKNVDGRRVMDVSR